MRARNGAPPLALRPRTSRFGRRSLFVQVFAVNAVLVVGAASALAFTPAYIPFPGTVDKALILVGGLAALLLATAALVRVTLRPLGRLERLMRDIDLLRPGQRLPVEGPAEIAEVEHSFNDMLGRLEDERQRSSGRALMAQEAERQRIARELHDEVGQSLTAVLLGLDDLALRASEPLRPDIGELQEIARESLDEVRAIARRLRPGVLEDLGLSSAIAEYTAHFEERTGIAVRRRMVVPLPSLTREAELAVYRVVQESLTNVARHAYATTVDVRVAGEDGVVRVSVRDDGVGMKVGREGDGGGIRGMRERALLVGGRLEVASAPPSGVEVILTVPARGEG
jgi:two-component system sensor histidine kinase UhpB